MGASPGAGTRNAVPYYDLPAARYVHHLVAAPPVRTSALRGLGAVAHVFAIESFLDELAAAVAIDPVQYRLKLLDDARARRVIEAVAEMSGWTRRGAAGSGIGLGIGFARYKNRAGFAAVVAEVEADVDVRVRRVWCAGDAGLVINPDGVAAQLEGGIVQATSWALKEQVRFDAGGIASRDWAGYPILRFSEVPEVVVRVLDGGDEPPVGMGEASCGPAVAAIGNALAHALGARVRDLPFTRARVARVLLR
jgi:CO/xanthine dehydrogenase Mo-binding subunit